MAAEGEMVAGVATTQTDGAVCAASASGEVALVPTACRDWSLNVYTDGNRRFWWNETYSISIWECVLELPTTVAEASLTDTDVWRAYIAYNIHAVYKMCVTCGGPEREEDMMVCCYCGGCVHPACSQTAKRRQVAWKAANAGYERFMRVCFACNGVKHRKESIGAEATQHGKRATEDGVRRAALRALTLVDEYPPHIAHELRAIAAEAVEAEDAASSQECTRHTSALQATTECGSSRTTGGREDATRAMVRLRELMMRFYQPGRSPEYFGKQHIAAKHGGVGIVARQDVPAFAIVGVYPGYRDVMCGEQVKHGRPAPRYALMDYNCADFDNNVFSELQATFTPFVNEPSVGECSNCAWIEEPDSNHGRLSIITVRPVSRGEELLICYGPLYHRDYAFCYDAYSCDRVEDTEGRPCYAVWHWTDRETTSATFVQYIAYDAARDAYAACDESHLMG